MMFVLFHVLAPFIHLIVCCMCHILVIVTTFFWALTDFFCISVAVSVMLSCKKNLFKEVHTSYHKNQAREHRQVNWVGVGGAWLCMGALRGPKQGHNWMCAARAGHRMAATSGSRGYPLSLKMKALCFIKMSETSNPLTVLQPRLPESAGKIFVACI